MTRSSGNQSCIYSPHLGPVGCLSAPNIFPLAKETFAKGKMFRNVNNTDTLKVSFILHSAGFRHGDSISNMDGAKADMNCDR